MYARTSSAVLKNYLNYVICFYEDDIHLPSYTSSPPPPPRWHWPKIWGKSAEPLGVVYDTDDTLLLGMYDSRSERGGHVHHYSKTGEFLKCVVKGIDKPNGLSIRNDTLAIADERSIVFYKKEISEDNN